MKAVSPAIMTRIRSKELYFESMFMKFWRGGLKLIEVYLGSSSLVCNGKKLLAW